MLAEMERLFRLTRSAVAAVVPTTVLPETLKVQPTDTDRRDAIQELLSIVQAHAGEPWADNLLQGEFGQKAPAAIQQLNEYIEAGNALQKAKAVRASAFAAGWSAFLKYKRLVRDTLGSSSRQHQGLRYRTTSADDAEEAEEAPGDEDATPVDDADGAEQAPGAEDASTSPESVAAPSVL